MVPMTASICVEPWHPGTFHRLTLLSSLGVREGRRQRPVHSSDDRHHLPFQTWAVPSPVPKSPGPPPASGQQWVLGPPCGGNSHKNDEEAEAQRGLITSSRPHVASECPGGSPSPPWTCTGTTWRALNMMISGPAHAAEILNQSSWIRWRAGHGFDSRVGSNAHSGPRPSLPPAPALGVGGAEGETLTWGHREQLGAETTRSRAGFLPSATPTLGLILLRCGAALRTAGCLATSPLGARSSPSAHDRDNEKRVRVLATPPGRSHRAEGGLFWDGSVTGGGRGSQ